MLIISTPPNTVLFCEECFEYLLTAVFPKLVIPDLLFIYLLELRLFILNLFLNFENDEESSILTFKKKNNMNTK